MDNMTFRKLTREFYERDVLTVAPELVGKYLVHKAEEGTTIGKIVEVEAYMGASDAASHAYRNKRTPRTEIQFGPGGFAYIYLIYGMYYCLNVVTNKIGVPQVVLIRALDPTEGIALMKKRSACDVRQNLCNGPGKLCRAMGITKRHYGMDLCGEELCLVEGEPPEDTHITTTPRINIDYAGEAMNYPWRYIISGNQCVSKSKLNPPSK